MSDAIKRAAEVITQARIRGEAHTAAEIAAALAAAGLLADDDTARLRKLGEAVEKLRAAMKNDTGIVDPGYRICLDAIYAAAGVTPEDGR